MREEPDQALDRTRPGLPIKPGRCGTMTHDYREERHHHAVRRARRAGRQGYRSLHAATPASGSSSGSSTPSRPKSRSVEIIHVILDNYGPHKHPKTRAWLGRHPLFVFQATPRPRRLGSMPSRASSPSWPSAASNAACSARSSISRPPSTASSGKPTMIPNPLHMDRQSRENHRRRQTRVPRNVEIVHLLDPRERAEPHGAIPAPCYDKDFSAWSIEHQCSLAAARETARGGTNQTLDWENIAEEIEDLSRRERQGLASRISTIIEHLVKLAHSSATDPRNGWRHAIRRSRLEIERILEASPSLKSEVANLVLKEAGDAVGLAMEDMSGRGELPRSLQGILKSKSYLDLFSCTPDQILGDWFPPEPQS